MDLKIIYIFNKQQLLQKNLKILNFVINKIHEWNPVPTLHQAAEQVPVVVAVLL